MQCKTQKVEQNKAQVVDLVRAAQGGDRQAFGELVERYQQAVFAMALRRLGNYAEAQELSQEVFLKAMEKLGQLKSPAAFGAWLRSITNRMAINRAVRRAPVTATEPELLEATCVERRTPLEAALDSEEQQRICAGIKRLGRMDRETLTAFYFRGRTLLEMSDEFASPIGTIKRRLHVARKRLAEQLESLAV